MIGETHKLEAIKNTPQGIYLSFGEEEILLPNKYVPKSLIIGDKLEVFIYLDFKNRPVATTLIPKVKMGEVASLKVFDVSDYGTFVEWGLEKHLLVPFSEQLTDMEPGKSYPVYLFKDDRSDRLVGSTKFERFFKENEANDINEGDRVEGIVYAETKLGYKTVVNQSNLGLIYKNETFQQIQIGDVVEAQVKNVRPDNKIDLTLNSASLDEIDILANKIYEALLREKGGINISDKSSPELIYQRFQVSKKAFKRAIGRLYSDRKISINPQSITLAEN